MTPTAEQILNDIQRLPLTDIEVISERVNEMLGGRKQNGGLGVTPDDVERREREFEQKMYAEGFFANIPPRTLTDDDDNFEPIEFDGEPLSEQIIRERR